MRPRVGGRVDVPRVFLAKRASLSWAYSEPTLSLRRKQRPRRIEPRMSGVPPSSLSTCWG